MNLLEVLVDNYVDLGEDFPLESGQSLLYAFQTDSGKHIWLFDLGNYKNLTTNQLKVINKYEGLEYNIYYIR